MSALQSAAASRAEAVKVSRILDYLGLWILFMVLTGSYHISRIVAMSFCEPRSCIGRLSS